VLLSVSRFDASSRTFQYRVNPHFGSHNGVLGASPNPFRITLEGKIDLSRDTNRQLLDIQLRNGPGGAKPSVGQVINRYKLSQPDVFGLILDLRDSLYLTNSQIEYVESLNDGYSARMDSVLTPFAEYLVSVPRNGDATEALDRSKAARTAAWNVLREFGNLLLTTLSPDQVALLPPFIVFVLSSPQPITMTYSS
jgi:hypothetical protein